MKKTAAKVSMRVMFFVIIFLFFLVFFPATASVAMLYEYTSFYYPSAWGNTFPSGINNAGEIVGQYVDGGGLHHGFLLSGNMFTSFDYPDARATVPNGINDGGQIVGFYRDSRDRFHGFLKTGDNFISFDYPNAVYTFGCGINNAGQIVGYYTDAGNRYHGFLGTPGSFTSFDYPNIPAGGTVALGINNTSQIVGYYWDGSGWGSDAFLRTGNDFITIGDDLPTPPQMERVAYGINDAGQIVGYYRDTSNVARGFLLDSGFTGIDYPTAAHTFATGINNAGQIVGHYLDSSGYGHGFQATPVPEPSPPKAICQDVTVAAGSNCLANASIDNGSFDPDGGPITITQSPAGPYPKGDTLVTIIVTDINGESDSCAATVTVNDYTAPIISNASVTPSILRPANHKMVPVTVTASASDNCGTAMCMIISVTSNEPINGLGHGDKTPDWEISGELTVNLRAECSRSGSGRIYTIAVNCADDEGNSSIQAVTVGVPTKGKKK